MLTGSKGPWAQFVFICRSHSAKELYSAVDLYSTTDPFPLHLFLWTSLALWFSWLAFRPCFSLGFLPHGTDSKMDINIQPPEHMNCSYDSYAKTYAVFFCGLFHNSHADASLLFFMGLLFQSLLSLGKSFSFFLQIHDPPRVAKKSFSSFGWWFCCCHPKASLLQTLPLLGLLYAFLLPNSSSPVLSLSLYSCYFGLPWPISSLLGSFVPFYSFGHPRLISSLSGSFVPFGFLRPICFPLGILGPFAFLGLRPFPNFTSPWAFIKFFGLPRPNYVIPHPWGSWACHQPFTFFVFITLDLPQSILTFPHHILPMVCFFSLFGLL